MSVTLQTGSLSIQATALPLTQEAFSSFGDVIANPRPDLHPATYASNGGGPLPYDGTSANQGTAIRYAHISRPRDLYHQSPSGSGELIMSQFVCATRQLDPTSSASHRSFGVAVLERHPFTTQTFSPLASTASSSAYLVVVAPSLPPSPEDASLPVPTEGKDLPGRGLPDLRGLRAFVASAGQAVTYGAGTWHAPMVALGGEGRTLDFLVVQFASGVADEDCQLAVLEGDGVRVLVPTGTTGERLEKL